MIIDLIVWLAILVIVLVVAWFLLKQAGLPEPANRIVTIVLVVVVAVIAIMVLLSLTGHGTAPRLLR